MAARSAGQVPWALVLVALAAVVASGHGLALAQAARNETAASANGETLDALLSTTSRAFSKSDCIEAIRIMKHGYKPGWYPSINISFPPDRSLTPPGAEEWCDCLRANEPVGGIPSDYEAVFDTCRDQVLVGSDFNAMDICRGMMTIFRDFDFWWNCTTFCNRDLCDLHEDYYCKNYPKYWTFERDAYDLKTTCGGGCMNDLSAGYCAKYRLTYGGWVSRSAYRYAETFREIAVDGASIGPIQRSVFSRWARSKITAAESMCDMLYPTDQGRCCTYERGYATLSQCCYMKNGALKFNCARSYGGDRLRYNCMKLSSSTTGSACNVLIDFYVAHPTYQQAELVKLPGGQTSVVFPEAFMDDFCDSPEAAILYAYDQYDFTPGTREFCCFQLTYWFGELVANCQPGAGSHTSLGAARLPPSVAGQPSSPEPTPSSCDACSYVDDKGKCKSVCKSTEECTVRGGGRAFCVRCDYFRQDFPDGKNRQCCQLRDGNSGSFCKTKVNNKGEKNKCFTDEGPWTNNKGAERDPQPYTINQVQNVCNAKENFWVNRKLCKVKQTADGKKTCKYISDKERTRILAGR